MSVNVSRLGHEATVVAGAVANARNDTQNVFLCRVGRAMCGLIHYG